MKHIVITDNTVGAGERVLIARSHGENFDVVAEVLARNGASHKGRLLEASVMAEALSKLTPDDYEQARRS